MLAVRKGTCDENVYKSVVEHNEYKLPTRFRPQDIIIDIGAHIGSFSLACWLRGSRNILAFEPNKENYELASLNLKKAIDHNNVLLYNWGIWRSDKDATKMFHQGYTKVNEDDELNTGGGNIFAERGEEVWVEPFDDILKEIGTDVELLKLDCEGSEFPILYTSQEIRRVRNIVMEWHELGALQNKLFPDIQRDCTVDGLINYLNDNGFEIMEYFRHGNTNLGMLWATRKD